MPRLRRRVVLVSAHVHAYDRTRSRADETDGTTLHRLHLACACGHVDELAIAEHDWERPGRARAHGRLITCSCHGVELGAVLDHRCETCERRTEHRVGVRAPSVERKSPRRGLRLVCKPCQRSADSEREIPVETQRAAALRYYYEHGRGAASKTPRAKKARG